MSADTQDSITNAAHDAQLAKLVDVLIDRIQGGEQIDPVALVSDYPEDADRLRKLLPTLEAMAAVAQPEGTGDATSSLAPFEGGYQPGVLGDFEIVREIGRGGMGVVYEARQISLVRRVALKVLPFAAVMDARQLCRFKNEAQAAATLDHPNIVSVYSIGSDRSVHYFAMQYIEGQTLAEVIRDLRQSTGLPVADQVGSVTRACMFLAGSHDREKLPSSSPGQETGAASTPTVRPPQAVVSTEREIDSSVFYLNVARLAIQAAEALDHAHERGIRHRDVKPGNLMLDETGKLWVTDFGLARVEGDAGMTMSGDLLGTLRYMSPEQALAKRVVVDHRSDIYSLGVTLYELLTLRPAFASDDRQELLRAIAFDEPVVPRTWNQAIPADLETVVLKAMAKDVGARYATAQELADDLKRFLADQPIRARRPNLFQQVRRWSRRHLAVVTTAGLVAACALLIAAGLLWHERSWTLQALAQSDANLRDAQEAIDKYLTVVSESASLNYPGTEPLQQELLEAAMPYYQRFLDKHRDDPSISAELTTAHKRLRQVYRQMKMTDLNGAEISEYSVEDLLARGRLKRQLGRFVDAERDFQVAVERCDQALQKGVTVGWQHFLRAKANLELGRLDAALTDVGSGRDENGSVLVKSTQVRAEILFEQQQFERAAIELAQAVKDAPGAGLLQSTLGGVLAELGRYDEAEEQIARALEAEPFLQQPHHVANWYRRGWIASMQGRHDVARRDFEEAVRNAGWDSLAVRRLAWFLATCPDKKYRDIARATTLAVRAVERMPYNGLFWYTLGICQYRAEKYGVAQQSLEWALELRDRPYSPLEEPRLRADFDRYAGFFLAMTQWQLGQKQKARETFDVAAAWMREHAPNDAQLARFRAEAAELIGLDVGTDNEEAVPLPVQK